MPRPCPKCERLTLRLDPDTMGLLRGYAVELGWPIAKVVAEALKAFDREVVTDDGGPLMLDELRAPPQNSDG